MCNAKTKMEIKFLLDIPCSVWVRDWRWICPFSSWYAHRFPCHLPISTAQLHYSAKCFNS